MKTLKNCLSILSVFFLVICGCNHVAAKKPDQTRYVEYQQQDKTVSVRNDFSTVKTSDFSAMEAAVLGSIDNGGFETGDFTGWEFGDNGIEGLDPWQVCPSFSCGFFINPADGMPNNNPVEGAFEALNGFDGEAGYEAYLYQDIEVPAEGGQISLYDRIQYDGYGIPSTLPRIYEIQVRDLNNNILEVLFHKEIMLDGQSETDLGWQQRILDISAYAGEMIRVFIQLSVPESFTGPAQIEFDNFQLTAGPAPDSDISGCIRLKGQPLAERPLVLWQEGEEAQTAETDLSGCYEFKNVASGKQFILMMNGPVVP
ncbi:MAG: hypothetical protein D3911_10160 [Candidatus Electrothrix sp. AW3_4]|nr:hypothetical protein [Candidatus Electrothrix gigas]